MKKISILLSMALNMVIASNSINIDIDLGSSSNILEHTNGMYFQAFMTDDAKLIKSNIRLRGAKDVDYNTPISEQKANEIYKLSKGAIVPTDPLYANKLRPIDLIHTGEYTKKIDFSPGIQIYSSNNIQIKRGYLFSQEFSKFLMLIYF